MNKYLYVLMTIVLLLIYGCLPSIKSRIPPIRSRENLFPAIQEQGYNYNGTTIRLHTKDSNFYLTNVQLKKDGSLEANAIAVNKKRRKPVYSVDLFLKSNRKAKDVLTKIDDTIKTGVRRVKLTDSTIVKAYQYKLRRGHDDMKMFYDRNWGLTIVLYIIALLITLLGVIVVVYSIVFMIYIILNPPTSTFCYIATMVYGDYNAPEVLVLRKFRDEKLAPYFCGRIFIAYYYATSPYFVKIFKNNRPVKKCIKWVLDKWVSRLSEAKTLKSQFLKRI